MRIASWNVNSLNVRLPHLQRWLSEFSPDVVGLQETKLEDHRFPAQALAHAGWHSVFSGQKTYNGVAILSRVPATAVQVGIPGLNDEQKRAIAASIGDLRIVNLYVVNGQDVGTDKYAYKLRWLAAACHWLRAELAAHRKLVVLGDFNIAPDPRDVHDQQIWNQEHILTSTAERDALRAMQALGLHDALRLHHQQSGIFSWWDYRLAGFRRNRGLRIDLTLVCEALKTATVDAGIDPTPRTWERPSDHAPAWVELHT